MNAIEALNIAALNLDKVNSGPEKLEAEVKRLKDVVKNQQKIIVSILKTLPEDQQNKILDIYNSKEG